MTRLGRVYGIWGTASRKVWNSCNITLFIKNILRLYLGMSFLIFWSLAGWFFMCNRVRVYCGLIFDQSYPCMFLLTGVRPDFSKDQQGKEIKKEIFKKITIITPPFILTTTTRTHRELYDRQNIKITHSYRHCWRRRRKTMLDGHRQGFKRSIALAHLD